MCFLFFCLELLEGFQNMSYDSLIRIYIYILATDLGVDMCMYMLKYIIYV